MIDLAALSAPFPPEQVSWRVGSTTKDKSKGMALAYIDARDVMERLDAVCGPAGWQCLYPHVAGKTVCNIGIKVGDEWIWKADGAGDSDVEAEKGALSDAFKRAAVKWGVGRYLYDVDSPWIALEQKGNSYIIAPGEHQRLRAVLGGKAASRQQPSEQAPYEAPSEEQMMLTDIQHISSEARLDKMIALPSFVAALEKLDAEAKRRVRTAIADRRAQFHPMVAG